MFERNWNPQMNILLLNTKLKIGIYWSKVRDRCFNLKGWMILEKSSYIIPALLLRAWGCARADLEAVATRVSWGKTICQKWQKALTSFTRSYSQFWISLLPMLLSHDIFGSIPFSMGSTLAGFRYTAVFQIVKYLEIFWKQWTLLSEGIYGIHHCCLVIVDTGVQFHLWRLKFAEIT